jgi:hypothetical protein
LRRLRGRVLARTPLGKRVVEFVDSNAADLSGALLEDEEAFGLTVRLVEPWLRRGNNFEILESKVDAETIQTFTRLAERLVKIQPSLREPIATFSDVISKAEGTTVRALLSKRRGARPKKKQTKPTRKK